MITISVGFYKDLTVMKKNKLDVLTYKNSF